MKKSILLLSFLSVFLISNLCAQQPDIGGFLQILQSFESESDKNQMEMQRVWLRIKKGSDDNKLGYIIILDTGGGKLLHNAFVWFKVPSFVFIPVSRITAGKFIPIFGRNWPTYPANLYAIDFSQTGKKTLLVRDVGVIWTIEQRLWKIDLSMTNGQEAKDDNGKDDNKGKDLYGRFLVKALPYLELGSSFRVGESKQEKSKVWGADFLMSNNDLKLIGEVISSKRHEDIFGYNLLGIYQPTTKIQLLVWYEVLENKTMGTCQSCTTWGVNWIMRPFTRLALNYVINPRNRSAPDKPLLLIQFQQVF